MAQKLNPVDYSRGLIMPNGVLKWLKANVVFDEKLSYLTLNVDVNRQQYSFNTVEFR